MSRLYRPDGSLAACVVCRRLHDAWIRSEVPQIRGPALAYYRCGRVVRRDLRTGAEWRCQAEASRELVDATERVRTGELAPLVDPEPWAVLSAA